jgi:hypothetical protein
MKISSSKKVILEELPSEVRGWFSKVTNIINPFFEAVYKILTNGITIGDNLKAQKFSLTIQANQTYPIEVAYTLNERPYTIQLAQIRENNSTSQVVQNYSFNWYIENNILKIYFAGLDSSKEYTANFYTLI